MEEIEIKEDEKDKFISKPKSILYFGPYYKKKISKLKIFIYGLRGVIK